MSGNPSKDSPRVSTLRCLTRARTGEIVETWALVQCPFCGKEHVHGRGKGHRVAHCDGTESRSYWLAAPAGDHPLSEYQRRRPDVPVPVAGAGRVYALEDLAFAVAVHLAALAEIEPHIGSGTLPAALEHKVAQSAGDMDRAYKRLVEAGFR